MYIYLAVSSAALGTVITFIVILFCLYFGIDLLTHLWLLAIPVISSLLLNVCFIELYDRHRKK